MITQLFKKQKQFTFEREYDAPVERVWEAWTRPELLRQWWAPDGASVAECEVDLQLGGRIHVVMLAGESMGKYAGTRWPLEGTFTTIAPHTRLVYDARSWTEGSDDTTIHHVNQLTLTSRGDGTALTLQIDVTDFGSGARMAAYGMKWGYKAYLDNLGTLLAAPRTEA